MPKPTRTPLTSLLRPSSPTSLRDTAQPPQALLSPAALLERLAQKANPDDAVALLALRDWAITLPRAVVRHYDALASLVNELSYAQASFKNAAARAAADVVLFEERMTAASSGMHARALARFAGRADAAFDERASDDLLDDAEYDSDETDELSDSSSDAEPTTSTNAAAAAAAALARRPDRAPDTPAAEKVGCPSCYETIRAIERRERVDRRFRELRDQDQQQQLRGYLRERGLPPAREVQARAPVRAVDADALTEQEEAIVDVLTRRLGGDETGVEKAGAGESGAVECAKKTDGKENASQPGDEQRERKNAKAREHVLQVLEQRRDVLSSKLRDARGAKKQAERASDGPEIELLRSGTVSAVAPVRPNADARDEAEQAARENERELLEFVRERNADIEAVDHAHKAGVASAAVKPAEVVCGEKDTPGDVLCRAAMRIKPFSGEASQSSGLSVREFVAGVAATARQHGLSDREASLLAISRLRGKALHAIVLHSGDDGFDMTRLDHVRQRLLAHVPPMEGRVNAWKRVDTFRLDSATDVRQAVAQLFLDVQKCGLGHRHAAKLVIDSLPAAIREQVSQSLCAVGQAGAPSASFVADIVAAVWGAHARKEGLATES